MALRVLVVDDSAVMRSMVVKVLHMTGLPIVEIREAENGKAGLDALEEGGIDLALVDINMPVMDGLTMLEKLRADQEYGRKAAVILLTNINDPEKVAQATDAGSYDFLVKSDWNIEDVVRKIKTRLGVPL